MHRRWPTALLAVLLVASAAPILGAEPPPAPVPSVEPAPSIAPDPSSPVDPPPPADPSTDPSAEPSPDPGASEPSSGPSAEPSPQAEPSPESIAADPLAPSDPTLDATDRYIVLLKPGVDARKVRDVHARADGLRADRVFSAVNGFAAKLDATQRAALNADPAVLAVVADEVIHLAAQYTPTGIRRVGARSALPLDLSGVDGVDADIAIVDTGIDGTHPDLNVRGGINCSSASSGAWRDVHGHGTHVAGIAAARDDDYGVVGVAPGARLWAVKILNDSGSGLLSWYVCGLDWIAAQRDPDDPDRPLIEAVNMSVAKSGSDDRNCGFTNNDILHQAICRLTESGVTVIAAAANESTYASKYVPAAYDEVITVSALADTDGRPGGLGPGSVCGSYNADDTFARFSNFGADVDLMAPGKCIRSDLPNYSTGIISGTSMAAPHVAGAVALYKATRSWATTADTLEALLALGSMDWKTATDPDGKADVLLDVSGLGAYGDFSLDFERSTTTGAPGTSVTIPFTIDRSTTHVERVTLSGSGPSGYSLAFSQPTLIGPNGVFGTMSVAIPANASQGTYTVTVRGTEHGRTRSDTTQLVVAPQAVTGAAYRALDPVRLLDTRVGNGLSGAFRDSIVRTFKVTGRGQVPFGAVGVTGNVTVVGQSSAGYVTLGPSVSPTPSTSTLNIPYRDIRAAGVTVAISSAGNLSIVWKGATNSTAHVVFDVTGYFVAGTNGLTYRALQPARVLDTRVGTGLVGTFKSSLVRAVQVSGQGGVPSDAMAITANLTVVGQTSAGYLSIGPTVSSAPRTSSLNVPRGDTRANLATVRLSGTGSLALVWKGSSGSTAHVIVDVTGYFTSSPAGALFHAIDPARIVDTRTGTGLSGSLATASVRTFAGVGLGPVPSDAAAITGTLTITEQTSAGYLSIGPIMISTPPTSTLNAPYGDNRANGFVNLVGPGGRLGIVWNGTPGSRTHAIVDVTGYYR